MAAFTVPEGFGSADRFSVSLDSIDLANGQAIPLATDGMTVIVGGNNSGKSTILRQVAEIISMYDPSAMPSPELVTRVSLQVTGDVRDCFAWLRDTSAMTQHAFNRLGAEISPDWVRQIYNRDRSNGRIGPLGAFVTSIANARNRFAMVDPTSRRTLFTEPAQHPLHQLEDNPALFDQLNDYVFEIFGSRITMDALSGSLMLRYGSPGIDAPPVDNVSTEYRTALGALGGVYTQGDGVASAIGLLLPLVAGKVPISLIDEPEAFLHPPQAYKLGRILAEIAEEEGSQLIVATHDRHFVAGALSGTAPTTILRLERSIDRTSAHAIPSEEIRSVWASPSVRHSDVLDGLFHRAVVIAEDERDCVFYAAALSEAGPLPQGLQATDVQFIASHGKGGVPELASILTAAHVPVVAALDLDAVNELSSLKSIVTSVGGKWTPEIDNAYCRATRQFTRARKRLFNEDVLRLISGVLGGSPRSQYTAETKRSVDAALKADSPWQPLKEFGIIGFTEERAAANELIDLLDDQSVALAQVGELERFAPTLQTPKGKGWLPAALDAGAHRSEEAQKYAARLANSILAAEARYAVDTAAPTP